MLEREIMVCSLKASLKPGHGGPLEHPMISKAAILYGLNGKGTNPSTNLS